MIAAINLGEVLWALLVLFVIVQVVVATFAVLWDLLRSTDLSGGAKAAWVLGFLILPLVTVVAYLLVRGDGIGERSLAREAQRPPAPVAATGAPATVGIATELQVAKSLLDDGTITDDEFGRIKQRLLAPT